MYDLPLLNIKFFVEKSCKAHVFSRFFTHFDVTSNIDVEPKGVPLQDPSKSNNPRKNINIDRIQRGNMEILILHRKCFHLVYKLSVAQKYTRKIPIPWTTSDSYKHGLTYSHLF